MPLTKINRTQLKITFNDLVELDRSYNGNSSSRNLNLNSSEKFKVNVGTFSITVTSNGFGVNREPSGYSLDLSGSFRCSIGSNFVDITSTGIRVYSNEISASQSADGIYISGGATGNPKIELRKANGLPHIDFSVATNVDYHARFILENNQSFKFLGNVIWRFESGDVQLGNYGRALDFAVEYVELDDLYPMPTGPALPGSLRIVFNSNTLTTGVWMKSVLDNWILIATQTL